MGHMTGVRIGPTDKEVTVNTLFDHMMGPRLHAPVRGRMTRLRHPDDLADSLRDASALLWRITNSIGTHDGKSLSRRSARRTRTMDVARLGWIIDSIGARYGKPISSRSTGRTRTMDVARLRRIANSIGARYGRPVNRRSARPTTATGVALGGGMLAGMGMMYLMDRIADRRHRALLRDKITHHRRVAERLLERKGRTLTHRVRGMVLERTAHAHDEVVDDAVLVERIRSHMGHLLSHAETRRIEVAVQDGQVALSGHVVASHVNRVLGHLATVPGVHGLVTKLTVHPSVADMMNDRLSTHRPEQGGTRRRQLQATGDGARPKAKA
jgi:BON domain